MEKFMHKITLGTIVFGDPRKFVLIGGPCVIEDEKSTLKLAEKISGVTRALKVPYVFKASFDKANRSSIRSFRGPGLGKGLAILARVKREFKLPILTDIHTPEQAEPVAEVADILQIPAFLCRQTDLLFAAAATGKIVNVKKGQFLSPSSMVFAINKIVDSGNEKVMITDRGTMFGYQDIIVDFRGIVEMKNFGKPVVLDITHSLQQPNQTSGVTGGKPEMIEVIARAGIACGVDGLFLETHPDPQNAKSDGANMLHLTKLDKLLFNLTKIREVVVTL